VTERAASDVATGGTPAGHESPVTYSARDRALFAVTALDLASSPARATHGTSARELTPPRKPSTPPGTVPVADAEHVRAHVQRAWWPTVAERPANWRGFLDARLTAPHDAIAPPRG